MEQFLQVGAITSTHGIRGEVKVFPTTDDPARFKKLKKVILDTGKRQIDMEIQSVRFFKQFVIVKFKGIDNINDVEQYKMCIRDRYTPCVAAVASIKRELGGKWAFFVVIGQCVIAWLAAFAVHTVAMLF